MSQRTAPAPAPAPAPVRLSGAVVLTAATVAVVVGAINADVATHKRWVAAADALRAEGVTAEFLGSDKEARKAFVANVVLLTFTKLEQSLVAKPAHALTDEQKITRRWVQAQCGSRLTRVVSYIAKAEKEESLTDEERGAKARASIGARLRKDLTTWIDRVEKAEAVDFSAVEMIRALKAAIVLIK